MANTLAAPTSVAPMTTHLRSSNLELPKTRLHMANTTSTQRPPNSSALLSTNSNATFSNTSLPESPDSSDYAYVIQSCHCIHLGRQIHAHALKRGFSNSPEFLETKLLAMYGRCSCVGAACMLFEKMLVRNIYSWVAILTVYVDHGLFDNALLIWKELLEEGIALEFFVFPVVFKACGGVGAIDLGRGLHGFVIKCEFLTNTYVGNALMDMYGKCGAVDEAMKVLKWLPERDCVSWNSVIAGCAANGMVFEALNCLKSMQLLDGIEPNLVSWSAVIGGLAQSSYDKEAIELLRQMLESGIKPNAQTLASILPACAGLQALTLGKEIHGWITRQELMSNTFVINGLIDVYRRCGDMESALELFRRFSVRNLVSYNTMIVGYCEINELSKARELFDQMELHGVKMDTITWNSMISGYCDNGRFESSLKLFRDMQMEEGIKADSFTLGSMLGACSALGLVRQGKEIHSYAVSRGLTANPFVGSALVEMYCKFRDLVAAEVSLFEVIERNTMTWNVLISGCTRANEISRSFELLSAMQNDGFDPNIYTWNGIIAGLMENGYNESTLSLLWEIQRANLKPDIFTIGMLVPICSRLVSTGRGKQLHAYSIRCGYDMDVHIGAALVDMYAKCGHIKLAVFAFHRISHHNLVSFNIMLAGYAMHGLWNECAALFHQMLADDITPDSITFLSVLSSCVHKGSVKEGHHYFSMMSRNNITPELKHYTCMVDLLSRSGELSEAYKLIQKMPMKPDDVVWGALLGGCVLHRNVELGEVAAKRLIELEGYDAGNYVLLANLYASAGKQEELARTRYVIRERGMHKNPGHSWIEIKEEIHLFLANDRSHEQADEIFATLESLHLNLTTQSQVLFH